MAAGVEVEVAAAVLLVGNYNIACGERFRWLRTEEELSQCCEESEDTLHVKLTKLVSHLQAASCISSSPCILSLSLLSLFLNTSTPFFSFFLFPFLFLMCF